MKISCSCFSTTHLVIVLQLQNYLEEPQNMMWQVWNKHPQSSCTFLVKCCIFYHLLKFLNQELWLPSPPSFTNKNPLIHLTQLKFVNDCVLRHTLNIKFSTPFPEYFLLCVVTSKQLFWQFDQKSNTENNKSAQH